MSKTDHKTMDSGQLLTETFRNSFASAAIGLAVVDLKGRWRKVNQSLCEIVGYTPQEMMNLNFRDLTHHDDLEGEQKLVKKLVAGEIAYYEIAKRYLHKEGQAIGILLTVTLVRDAGGAPLYFVCQVEKQGEEKS